MCGKKKTILPNELFAHNESEASEKAKRIQGTFDKPRARPEDVPMQERGVEPADSGTTKTGKPKSGPVSEMPT